MWHVIKASFPVGLERCPCRIEGVTSWSFGHLENFSSILSLFVGILGKFQFNLLFLSISFLDFLTQCNFVLIIKIYIPFFSFMWLDFSLGWNFLLFVCFKVQLMFNLSEILGEGSTLRHGVEVLSRCCKRGSEFWFHFIVLEIHFQVQFQNIYPTY